MSREDRAYLRDGLECLPDPLRETREIVEALLGGETEKAKLFCEQIKEDNRLSALREVNQRRWK